MLYTYARGCTIFIRRPSSGGNAGGLPCPFLKIQKYCFDFAKKCLYIGKMCPVCVYLWVKFSFKMQFFQYLGAKPPKFLLVWFRLLVVHETFIKVPLFQETFPARKDSWLRTFLPEKCITSAVHNISSQTHYK